MAGNGGVWAALAGLAFSVTLLYLGSLVYGRAMLGKYRDDDERARPQEFAWMRGIVRQRNFFHRTWYVAVIAAVLGIVLVVVAVVEQHRTSQIVTPVKTSAPAK